MLPLAFLADAATGFLVGIPVFVIVLVAALSIFWLWMLIDALVNPRLNGAEKIIWVVVVAFLHILGALLYFFIGRSQGGGTTTSV